MRGTIYIDGVLIGKSDFKVVDPSMGGIEGVLVTAEAYFKYRDQIQRLTESKGIANVEDLDLTIRLENGTTLDPHGGIGIVDGPSIDEIIVESAGIDHRVIDVIVERSDK